MNIMKIWANCGETILRMLGNHGFLLFEHMRPWKLTLAHDLQSLEHHLAELEEEIPTGDMATVYTLQERMVRKR